MCKQGLLGSVDVVCPVALLLINVTTTLSPQELHGRRSSDDQQGAGRRLAWLVALAAAGAPAMSYPRRPRNRVVDRASTSPSPTATAGTCQAALPRPSVLPGAALIACANKAHTVNGDGVAEACAVRTHAACTSTLWSP